VEVIKKSNKHEVRVEAIEYGGRRAIDVRVWVWAKEKEDYIPTRRGVTVQPDQVDSLISGLIEAKEDL
jgi:hypothetical protein|tara:strand:+ start:4708 stop:4911 length:204 start_codon:yes stop_codon:yes gene_type:complete